MIMDRDRAFTEINRIFGSKETENWTHSDKMKEVSKVLYYLQKENYNLGKRQGMFKAVNLLTELAEKENKTEN